MMNTSQKLLSAAAGAALLLSLVGCAQQPQNYFARCNLSNTNNVDRLFSELSEKLESPKCHYSYPVYRERLLTAAKGSPGPENEARFAGLLRESIDGGVISQRQGQALFGQYFDAEFYVVKSEPRSSCTSLRDRDKLQSEMRKELGYKRVGMLEILGDEARFRRAQHYYNDMSVVFEAVDEACTRET